MKTPLNILILFKEERHASKADVKTHHQALKTVQATLKKYHLSYETRSRGTLQAGLTHNFFISVGGDGTFLEASHYAPPQALLLGVNSNPHLSHGAFCQANAKTFEKTWIKILQGKASILELQRLQIFLNQKPLAVLALNDVLLTHPCPAATSRYELKVGSKKEEQKSSGIWISTAVGSTAAIRSAGGKVLAPDSKKWQFVVREPFIHPGGKYKMTRGILSPHEKIEIVSKRGEARLFVDGAHLEYEVKYGDKVKVQLAKSPIRAVL